MASGRDFGGFVADFAGAEDTVWAATTRSRRARSSRDSRAGSTVTDETVYKSFDLAAVICSSRSWRYQLWLRNVNDGLKGGRVSGDQRR